MTISTPLVIAEVFALGPVLNTELAAMIERGKALAKENVGGVQVQILRNAV